MDNEQINTAFNDSLDHSEVDNDFFDPMIFFFDFS